MHSVTSIWKQTTQTSVFEPLREDLETDVLIVGGGIAGILCAYMLDRAGVDYALVEAERICDGITKNTTAKITSQHGLIYHSLIRRFGEEKARLYLEANENAVETYRKLCKDIDCGFEEKDAFTYSLHKPKLIEKELRALERIGYPAKYADNLPLPFPTAGAVRFEGQAQFHPLKFAYAIAKDLRIYEKTKVLEFAPHTAITSGGKIKAKKIVVATHFPIINKHGFYFLKMYQPARMCSRSKTRPT